MRVFLVLLLSVCAASAAPAKRAVKVRTEAAMSRVEEVAGGRFKAAVPPGWRVTKDSEGTGLQATAPGGTDGPAPTASAVYYPKGNRYFKDAADFLARQTAPSPVPLEGEKTGPVEAATLAGRKARRLSRDTFAVYHPPAAEPREVAVKEEVTVLEGKEGFWVMTLSAPAPAWTKSAAAFKTFRDGFRTSD